MTSGPGHDGAVFFASQDLDNRDPVLHLLRTIIAWSNGGNVLQTKDAGIPLDRTISISNPFLSVGKLKELFPSEKLVYKINQTNREALAFRCTRSIVFDDILTDIVHKFMNPDSARRLEAIIVWKNSDSASADSNDFQDLNIYFDSRICPLATQEELRICGNFEDVVYEENADTHIKVLALKPSLSHHVSIAALKNNFDSSLEFYIPRFIQDDNFVWNIRLNNFPREFIQQHVKEKLGEGVITEIQPFNLNGRLSPVSADKEIDAEGSLISSSSQSDLDSSNTNYHIDFAPKSSFIDVDAPPSASRGVLRDVEHGLRLNNMYCSFSWNKTFLTVGSYSVYELNPKLKPWENSIAAFCSYFMNGIDLGVRRNSNKWTIQESKSKFDRAYVDSFSVVASSKLHFDGSAEAMAKYGTSVYAVAGSVTFKNTVDPYNSPSVIYTCKGVTVLPYSLKWLKANLKLNASVDMNVKKLMPSQTLIKETMKSICEEYPDLTHSLAQKNLWSSHHYLYLDNIDTKGSPLEVLFPKAMNIQEDRLCKRLFRNRETYQALLLYDSMANKTIDVNAFKLRIKDNPNPYKFYIMSQQSRELNICKFVQRLCRCSREKNFGEKTIKKYCGRSFYQSAEDVYEACEFEYKDPPTTCPDCREEDSNKIKFSLSTIESLIPVYPSTEQMIQCCKDRRILFKQLWFDRNDYDYDGDDDEVCCVLPKNRDSKRDIKEALAGCFKEREFLEATLANPKNYDWRLIHQFFRSSGCDVAFTFFPMPMTPLLVDEEETPSSGNPSINLRVLFVDEKSKNIAAAKIAQESDVIDFATKTSIEIADADFSDFAHMFDDNHQKEKILKSCLATSGFNNVLFVQCFGATTRIFFSDAESKNRAEITRKKELHNLGQIIEKYIKNFSVEVTNFSDNEILWRFFKSSNCNVALICILNESRARVFFEDKESRLIASSMTHFLKDFIGSFSATLSASNVKKDSRNGEYILEHFFKKECSVLGCKELPSNRTFQIFFSNNDSKLKATRDDIMAPFVWVDRPHRDNTNGGGGDRGRVGGGKTGGGKSQGKFSLLSGEDSPDVGESGDSADENHTASEVLEKTGTSTLIDDLVAFVQQQPSKALPIDKLQFFYGTCKRLDTKQKRQNWDINAAIKESNGRLKLDKVNTKKYIIFVDVKSKKNGRGVEGGQGGGHGGQGGGHGGQGGGEKDNNATTTTVTTTTATTITVGGSSKIASDARNETLAPASSISGGSAVRVSPDKTRVVSEAPQEVRVTQDTDFWGLPLPPPENNT
jgi:hypothetical protein